jgi:hypothetical protein
MNWQEVLNQILPVVGNVGVRQLENLLNDVASDQEGWKRSILHLIADAVEKHGPSGIQIAMDALNGLFEGETVDINWANPRVASDLVGALQNAEADAKSSMHDFGVEVSHTLGTLLAGLLKGLITSL